MARRFYCVSLAAVVVRSARIGMDDRFQHSFNALMTTQDTQKTLLQKTAMESPGRHTVFDRF